MSRKEEAGSSSSEGRGLDSCFIPRARTGEEGALHSTEDGLVLIGTWTQAGAPQAVSGPRGGALGKHSYRIERLAADGVAARAKLVLARFK